MSEGKTSERCDVPEVGACVVLPVGAVLPDGFTRGVLYLPLEAYCATVAARGHDAIPTEVTDDYSPALRKAMRKASKGVHKVYVRAMYAKIAEMKDDGKSDDEIILLLNRGEAFTDDLVAEV